MREKIPVLARDAAESAIVRSGAVVVQGDAE